MVSKLAWSKNGTPNTLGSAADDMDITDLTAYNFNMVMIHQLTSGTDFGSNMTFNNDSTTYADRRSINGGADATDTSQSSTRCKNGFNDDEFFINYICDISGEEKLRIAFCVGSSGAGATNAPDRLELNSKFDDTSARITRIDLTKSGADQLAASSNISVIGTD